MRSKDPRELANLREISNHAYCFYAVYLMKSIKGGAKLLGIDKKSISNHMKWMECLTGENLLGYVAVGQNAKLTAFGRELGKRLENDFDGAVQWLNENKKDGVVGKSFIKYIKTPDCTSLQSSRKD
jgi:molybdenum-dependent DNA-binding transcriptional regulator ModE